MPTTYPTTFALRPMARLLTVLLGALLFASAVAVPARAQTAQQNEIRTLLQQRDREIKSLLGARTSLSAAQKAELKDLINGAIDFEAMGRTALGPHWKDLSAAERTRFVNVFSSIVREQSLADLDLYRTPVAYKAVEVDGTTARATTEITYQDVPATVVYVLGRSAGTWRVHDIILDDVSTAEGYARSFQAVVRKRGFDTLMKSLDKKLASVKAAQGS